MKTIHARIEGRVQGVFFRESTRRKAETLGLQGWVKNLMDGAVEAIISGENEKISTMVTWLHSGPPHATVTKILITDHQADHDFSDFRILF